MEGEKKFVLAKCSGNSRDAYRNFGSKRELGFLISEADARRYRASKEYVVLNPELVGCFDIPKPPENYSDEELIAELNKRLGQENVAFVALRREVQDIMPSCLLERLFEFDDNNGKIPGILRKLLYFRNGNVHQISQALSDIDIAVEAKSRGLSVVTTAWLEKLELVAALKTNQVAIKAILENLNLMDGVMAGEHVAETKYAEEVKPDITPVEIPEVKELNESFGEGLGFNIDVIPEDLYDWPYIKLSRYTTACGLNNTGTKTELMKRIYDYFNKKVKQPYIKGNAQVLKKKYSKRK